MQSDVGHGAPARLIGQVLGDVPGPTVILLGGVHGNEPAGVQALQQVLALLHGAGAFRGRLTALRGNMAALQARVRYVDEDLNRLWQPERIRRIMQAVPDGHPSSEQHELRALLQAVNAALALRPPASGFPTVIGDLHSFSAPGRMFGLADSGAGIATLFRKLGVPLVVGMQDKLHGTAFEYFSGLVDTAFVIEGGQHDDPGTVQRLASSILSLLVELGCVDAQWMARHAPVSHPAAHAPERVRPVYRHPVQPEDGFRMRPGFSNLQQITQGEWLASDRLGRVLAPDDGYLLMPLYQAQGSDGFFIVRDADMA